MLRLCHYATLESVPCLESQHLASMTNSSKKTFPASWKHTRFSKGPGTHWEVGWGLQLYGGLSGDCKDPSIQRIYSIRS